MSHVEINDHEHLLNDGCQAVQHAGHVDNVHHHFQHGDHVHED